MSSWVPSAAPLVEETSKCPPNGQDDMLLDMHLITCLESALEKRREDAIKADAPMPMGVGTSSFRTADRLDPAASIPEAAHHDEMDMEGDHASDGLSDDAVLGMMEDADHGDGMTDGSNEVSGDDDDDNLTEYL